MKSVKYKVIRLNTPEGDNTHQLVYETETKLTNQTGGFNYGIKHRGTYRECLNMKKELENENPKRNDFRLFNET